MTTSHRPAPHAPSPTEIRLAKSKDSLSVAFPNEAFSFTAEFLRVNSPSAEVQGHGYGEKKLIPGKKNVTITAIEPVGHYAIRLTFSDGHSTGIYTWDYFAEMGEKQFDVWAEYTQALKKNNLSREAGEKA